MSKGVEGRFKNYLVTGFSGFCAGFLKGVLRRGLREGKWKAEIRLSGGTTPFTCDLRYE